MKKSAREPLLEHSQPNDIELRSLARHTPLLDEQEVSSRSKSAALE